MLSYEASIQINAPAEQIWKRITNAQDFQNWDPDVIRIEGEIEPNNKITVYSKVSPDRAFPVTVSEFTPNRKMVWSSGMPLGLFKGQRTFTLTESGDQTTYHVIEEFSGLLLPIIGRTIPNLSEAFTRHAEALKVAVENPSEPA